MKRMYIFIDTEFTDFTNMELISLGAVSEDGNHQFYVEITDHCADYRSDFVNQIVIPLLDTSKYGKSRAWAALDYKEWLESLPCEEVVILVDYVGDYMLSAALLNYQELSVKVSYEVLSHALTSTLHDRGFHTPAQLSQAHKTLHEKTSEYFDIDPRQHHALVDAKANRHGWVEAFKAIK